MGVQSFSKISYKQTVLVMELLAHLSEKKAWQFQQLAGESLLIQYQSSIGQILKRLPA